MSSTGWPTRIVAALSGLACACAGLVACSTNATPTTSGGCPNGFSAAVIWSSETSSPTWIQYFDKNGNQVGNQPLDVQGIFGDDQTPGHDNGQVILSARGNTIHDQTHLISVNPNGCRIDAAKADITSPLQVVPFDGGFLTFSWINGYGYLTHFDHDGQQVAVNKTEGPISYSGLAVGPDAVYTFGISLKSSELWLSVLDRTTLKETKRIPLPMILDDTGPLAVSLVGDEIFFPLVTNHDHSTTTKLGVINVKTFKTSTIELGSPAPYLFHAVGTTLYIGHGTMQDRYSHISVVDTTTRKVTGYDLDVKVGNIDTNASTIAVSSPMGSDDIPTLSIYNLPDFTLTSRVQLTNPEATATDHYVLGGVFVP